MRLVYPRNDQENEAIANYVATLIPRMADLGFGKCRAVGVIDQHDRMVAGWVWHNWNPVTQVIEFSGASLTPQWMTRRILHELFSFAFDGAQCQMVATLNAASSERLHDQLWKFGFDRFDVPRLFGRDEDAVFWTLTEEQWRASRFYIKDELSEKARNAEAA